VPDVERNEENERLQQLAADASGMEGAARAGRVLDEANRARRDVRAAAAERDRLVRASTADDMDARADMAKMSNVHVAADDPDTLQHVAANSPDPRLRQMAQAVIDDEGTARPASPELAAIARANRRAQDAYEQHLQRGDDPAYRNGYETGLAHAANRYAIEVAEARQEARETGYQLGLRVGRSEGETHYLDQVMTGDPSPDDVAAEALRVAGGLVMPIDPRGLPEDVDTSADLAIRAVTRIASGLIDWTVEQIESTPNPVAEPESATVQQPKQD
jgi:hypothetical protein